jgi:hypothetical protein
MSLKPQNKYAYIIFGHHTTGNVRLETECSKHVYEMKNET